MPVSKKRKHTRREEKVYQYVEFNSSIYEGDPFVFPKASQMSQKVATALDSGNFSLLYDWLRDAGVDEDSIEAFSELDSEETMEFMKEWTDGAPTSVPKSSK